MARILDVTPEQYLKDPCERPSLSSSIAHKIVAESPMHAFYAHPRLHKRLAGDGEIDASEAMNRGSIFHSTVLGKGKDVLVLEYDEFRTNEAKAARDAARRSGKPFTKRKHYDEIVRKAHHYKGILSYLGHELTGQSEVAIEFNQGPTLCRAMIDHLILEENSATIFDLKFVADAHPEKIARNFITNGYDIASVVYTEAVACLHPHLRGKIEFVFLFCESGEVPAVVSAVPDGVCTEIGRMRWMQALSIWERCRETGHWPSYVSDGGNLVVSPPAYIASQYLGSEWTA